MDYWQQKAKESKIPRVNWRKILGKRLTTWLFLQFESGGTKTYCYNLLKEKIRNYYAVNNKMEFQFPLEKIIENAKISVSARYAEYKRRLNV